MLSTNNRRGLTLTELLVVIAILVAVTAVLAPLVTSTMEGREVREAARQVNAYFQQAQARARELGRPVGVVIRRLPYTTALNLDNPALAHDFGYQLTLAEEPPPYRGTLSTARAMVWTGTKNLPGLFTVPGSDQSKYGCATAYLVDPGLVPGAIQPNDMIRFNLRGPRYRIVSIQPNTSVPAGFEYLQDYQYRIEFEFDAKKYPQVAFARFNSVQFEVFRRPQTTAATPMDLPTGSAIVMNLSGVGMEHSDLSKNSGMQAGEEDFMQTAQDLDNNATTSSRQQYIGLTEFQRPNSAMLPEFVDMPLTIMFTPEGTIDRIYRVLPGPGQTSNPLIPPKKPQDKIYLFLGKAGVDRIVNFADTTNLWLAIDPQNGSVTTAPNTLPFGFTVASATSNVNTFLGFVAASRQLAATGQSMGGG